MTPDLSYDCNRREREVRRFISGMEKKKEKDNSVSTFFSKLDLLIVVNSEKHCSDTR